MHHDAVHKHVIKPFERVFFRKIEQWPIGQGRHITAFAELAVLNRNRLAGQNALYAVKNRVTPGRELKLQQFIRRFGADTPVHQSGFQKNFRLGRENHAAVDLRIIKRLDAERIARQVRRALACLHGDAIHAAKIMRETRAVTGIGIERQFAIAFGRKIDAGKFPLQLDVIVNLAIGDEHRSIRPE